MADYESFRACGMHAKVCRLDETQARGSGEVDHVGNR